VDNYFRLAPKHRNERHIFGADIAEVAKYFHCVLKIGLRAVLTRHVMGIHPNGTQLMVARNRSENAVRSLLPEAAACRWGLCIYWYAIRDRIRKCDRHRRLSQVQ